jgi:hypothetical protein
MKLKLRIAMIGRREECITETIKPKQWQAIRQKFSDVNKATVVLDIGFLVRLMCIGNDVLVEAY